jgi:predicted permease
MGRLIFVLGISIGSVFAGYVLKRIARGPLHVIRARAGDISRIVKLTSIFVLNPIPIVNSFWQLQLESGRLALFPLLGLLSLATGGTAAVLVNRVFHIPPKRAASVFVASMFTNIVTFGGLTAFVFFGYDGYVFVQLFNMFVSLAYYAVGFPISEQLAMENRTGFAISPRIILDRPYLLAPIRRNDSPWPSSGISTSCRRCSVQGAGHRVGDAGCVQRAGASRGVRI